MLQTAKGHGIAVGTAKAANSLADGDTRSGTVGSVGCTITTLEIRPLTASCRTTSSVFVFVYVCVYMYVCETVSVYKYAYVCVSMLVCLHVSLHVCVFTCMLVCVYMYVCVYVCV